MPNGVSACSIGRSYLSRFLNSQLCSFFFFFFEIPFLWYFLDLIEALDLNNKDFLRNYIIATFSRLPYSQRLKGYGSTINFI